MFMKRHVFLQQIQTARREFRAYLYNTRREIGTRTTKRPNRFRIFSALGSTLNVNLPKLRRSAAARACTRGARKELWKVWESPRRLARSENSGSRIQRAVRMGFCRGTCALILIDLS